MSSWQVADRRQLECSTTTIVPTLDEQYKKLDAAACGMNLTLVRKDAADLAEIETAFTSFKGQQIKALLVTADFAV